MRSSAVLDAWRSGDTAQLAVGLARTVVFSSPVADYRGRANAAHVLGLIATVLEQVDETARWCAERDSVFAFTAQVDGGALQGVIREECDAGGAITYVTLFLRPYRVLRGAMATMAQRLEDSPLPESVR